MPKFLPARRPLTSSVCTVALLFISCAAVADYPDRPVRIVVPYTPASSADSLGRLLSDRLTARLKQSFVVENRPGASGIIGSGHVATAPADGYTLMVAPTTHVISPAFRKTSYDPIKDFSPIAMIATGPMVIVCNPSNPATNLQELVRDIKKAGDAATYSSPGIASTIHLYTALFQETAGTQMRHVPAKNFTAGMMDVIQGQITMMIVPVDVARPHLESGKLRAIAQTGKVRSSLAPDLPTVAEAGYPDFDVSVWTGLYAPARTPKPIVDKLYEETRRVFEQPEVAEQIARKGMDVDLSSPAEFSAFNLAEYQRWARVIKQAGISPE